MAVIGIEGKLDAGTVAPIVGLVPAVNNTAYGEVEPCANSTHKCNAE